MADSEFRCPEPNPDGEDAFGKCHICKEEKPISCCAWCEHFFCSDCRGVWWKRSLEAIKERIGGKHPGCCGPINQEAPNV